jgi:hypothetical protein
MEQGIFRALELVFTAYMVPALLVPLVWIGLRLRRAFRGPSPETPRTLARIARSYAVLAALWLAAWLALRVLPFEPGGRLALAVSWLAYLLLNVVFATLLVRFTSGYGSLPEGDDKDRLFLRLLGVILAQPVTTACAFAVLYRLMGVAYQLTVPGLPVVQEGI